MSAAAVPERLPPRRRVALAVAGILLLQVVLAWGRLGLPFLDGRLHHDYDNAVFAVCARTGILLGDARSQMGVTQVRYDSWGSPVGTPGYYTHHPFLFKAAFQVWVRGFGDSELSTRAFALAVSMVAAAGAVTALAIASGSALAAALGTAVLVSTPLFAMFQLSIKFELDGMAVGTWLLAITCLALKRPTRGVMAFLVVLAALAPLAHWTAMLLVVSLIAWLAAEQLVRGARDAQRPLLGIISGAGAGGLVLLAAFIWLKGGWAPFLRDQLEILQVHKDVSTLRPGEWNQKQLAFAAFNFTPALTWVAGVLAAAHGVIWAIRRITVRPAGGGAFARALPAFFLCTLATASAWVFGFAQASFVHNYMQIWYLLPVAALVTATIRLLGRSARWAAATATGALVVWLCVASFTAIRDTRAAEGGTVADVAFLRTLRTDRFERFVFIPTREDPLNGWFAGPIFEYYTARPVTRYDRSVTLTPADKVLLLRSEGRAVTLAQIDSLLGIHLANEKCGARLCAYDVRSR